METRVQALRIDRSDGWTDRSMLVLTSPQPSTSGMDANLIVTREPLRGTGNGADAVALRVEAHVDEQIEDWRGRPGFEEVSRRRATAAHPVAELRLVWTDADRPLAQWLTFTPAAGDTLVVAACTAARAYIAAVEPEARRMLETLKID